MRGGILNEAIVMVFSTTVIERPQDVDQRLSDFGLVRGQILAIRDAARAASDDASPLAPVNAPGTLAYISGVQALREQILGPGWVMARSLGIEAVINESIGIRLCYQNVDRACDDFFKPMPRSGKGAASASLCCLPLFEHFGVTLPDDADRLKEYEGFDPSKDHLTTYFVMVGEDGNVELSSPVIEGQRFSKFRERIFVDRLEVDVDGVSEYEAAGDFEFDVTMKEVV